MADELTHKDGFEAEQQIALADKKSTEEYEPELSELVALVQADFQEAKDERTTMEQRLSQAYNNHRGFYNKRVKFTSEEKSQAFIKITKTKVQAAYGQLLEIIFSEGKLPITVEPTDEPLGIEEIVHFSAKNPQESEEQTEPEEPIDIFGFEGDGDALEPGATLLDRVGYKLKNAFKNADVKKGEADEPHELNRKPAQIAAKKMQKKIQDQLEESDAVNHISKALYECCLLGTGIIKGPFLTKKEYPRWVDGEEGERTYDPIIKIRPALEYVSVWNFYPDPAAKTPEEATYFIERHKMSTSQLRGLKSRPAFRSTAINAAIERGPISTSEWWEHTLEEEHTDTDNALFEVLERWGTVEVSMLKEELGKDFPEELENMDEVEANIWVCNGEVIRAVLNPFKPRRKPYHIFHYEKDLYNFFGVGVAENMQDSQTLMNGFVRLAVDNAVLAGNMMLDVDETNLVPGQSMELTAGKIFRRQGGAGGQAIFPLKFTSTANENMQMFDRMRVLADESTGIPSFSHGQTGVSGVGRTASGISMLLGAASLTTKTVVKNIDVMFKQLGESYFAFNMQFDPDPEIVGDLEIKARGTASLIQKEVRSQRILQLLQLAMNPAITPFANMQQIWKEAVMALDLDGEGLSLDQQQAELQAALIGKATEASQAATAAGANLTPDASQPLNSGGNIAAGTPPSPGEETFSGNPQQEG